LNFKTGNCKLLEVSLDFLTPDTVYIAEIFAHGNDANWRTNSDTIDFRKVLVYSQTAKSLNLVPGGGQAFDFSQLPQ